MKATAPLPDLFWRRQTRAEIYPMASRHHPNAIRNASNFGGQTFGAGERTLSPAMKCQNPRPVPANAIRIDQLQAKHAFLADRGRWLRDLRNLDRLDSWLIGGRVVYSESEVLALTTYSPARSASAPSVAPLQVADQFTHRPVPDTDVRAVIVEGLGMYLEDVSRELVDA
jgi:hypothetical protein